MTRRTLILTFALLLAGVVGTAGTASAQALKVGYTDHELIIANMPQFRQVQEQLQREVTTGQEELQTMAQDFQERLERYQKQQALLSEQSRAEREKELTDLQTKIQEETATKERALATREAELLAPIYEQVQNAINAVAQEKGLDIVLRSQVSQGVPVILYVNPQTVVNVTEDVARRLGLDVDAAPSETPAASNTGTGN